MPYMIEVTDTFGGDANYCWIKRGTTRARTRRGLINAVKRAAGWRGWCRVRVAHCVGVPPEEMEIRPTASSGIPQVAFVYWADTDA